MTCTKKNLEGTFTALVTPFTADGSKVDYESLERLLGFQISSGVQGIVACGSTGEAATLSDEEYREVVSFTVRIVRERAIVIGGVGSSATARAQSLAQDLTTCGVDAVMVVAPPYNKPPQEGIIAHFKAIKKVTPLPLIAYNVPGRSGVNILPRTIAKLSEDGVIIGVKESSGSVDQALDILALVGDSISLISGEDSLTFPLMACGGRGVISVLSNVEPGLVLAVTDSALKGDWNSARKYHFALLEKARAMFIETNPIPVKCALALKKIIGSDALRLPLVPAERGTHEKLGKLFCSAA